MKKINTKILKVVKNKNSTRFLYLISFVESIFFPIPTDLFIIPIALINKNKVIYITLLTTIFSVLGGIIGYIIGLYFFNEIGQALLSYYNLENQFTFFTDLIIEYGYLFIFIAGFTPVPYKIAAIGSGFINLPILIFIIASFFSRGLRFFIVTYFSSRLGASAEKIISKYFFYISLLLFLIIIIILIFEIIL
jgi:membrane protein YqaA with SNARE-associated domain